MSRIRSMQLRMSPIPLPERFLFVIAMQNIECLSRATWIEGFAAELRLESPVFIYSFFNLLATIVAPRTQVGTPPGVKAQWPI